MMFRVHLLPSLVTRESLAGKRVVVIDVLRATTTIATALAAGAKEVIPCLEVDEARRLAAELLSTTDSSDDETKTVETGMETAAGQGRGAPQVVLGGERGGLKIEGFELGNSPREYTPLAVRDKTIVFTTTNGTKAMRQCELAATVYLAAFVNFGRVCHELCPWDEVDVVCAGTNDEVTREDVLLAGALADEWLASQANSSADLLNDAAALARDAWRDAATTLGGGPVTALLADSSGGRNLIQIGHREDLDIAAEIDSLDVLPALDLKTWRIR